MSAGDLHVRNHKEITRLKRIRCERLRPVRAELEGLPVSVEMDDYDSEKARLRSHTGGQCLSIDLTQPLPIGGVLDWLEQCFEDAIEHLEDRLAVVQKRMVEVRS